MQLSFLSYACSCSVAPTRSQESRSLVLSQTISLRNVQGGFNHMSVDVEHLRLFVAAPTNNTLEIVGLKTGKIWRTLEGGKLRPYATRLSSINSTSLVDKVLTFATARP
jgi:hypothetical protein